MKKPYKDEFDKQRRSFLGMLGAAGVSQGLLRASPLVSGIMYSRMAEAQTGVNKIVTFYAGNGALPNMWHGNPGSLPPFSAPLDSVAPHIAMIDGIKAYNPHSGGLTLGHGQIKRVMIKDWGGGESFDVNMGRIIGANRRFPYLIGGIHQNFNGGAPGYSRDNGADISMEQNPFNMFERVFGAAPTSTTTNPKKHIVDGHMEAIKALQSKLGQHEKIRLDSHLTAIEEKARQIESSGGGDSGGGTCSAPTTGNRFSLNMSTIREQFKLFTDIYALAMKCDLVGSATMYFGDDNCELSFQDVVVNGRSYTQTIHTASHDDNGRHADACCDNYPLWLAQRVELTKLQAYMIKKFADEGLLNSTVIAMVSDQGNGDDHLPDRVPVVIAGGGIGRGNKVNANTHLFDVWHSLAVKLGANTNSRYQGYGNNVIF